MAEVEVDRDPILEVNAEQEESQSDCEPHAAIVNPLILKTIFEFLSLPELKQCREVSRVWCDLTYPGVQNQARVTLTHEKINPFQLSKFLNFVKENYNNPEDVIFKNYQLKFQKMTEAYRLKPKSRLGEFMTTIGSSIETLHLNRCKMDKGSLGRFIESNKFPKLIHLILEECVFIFPEVEEGADLPLLPDSPVSCTNNIRKFTFHSDTSQFAEPFELRHFWAMFPSLTDLCLTDLTTNQSLEILDSAVEIRRTTGQPVKLEKLRNIFGDARYSLRRVPEILLNRLCNTGFPLTLLEVDIGENISEPEFEQLIRSFAGTLESLVIWRGLLAYKIQGFPYGVNLSSLRHLRIPENCLQDMTFVKYMRNLISLTVLQCDRRPSAYQTDLFQNRLEFEQGGQELTPLTSVKFFKIEYAITEEDIKFVRWLFPSLLKLSAFVGNQFVTRQYY